MRIAIFTETIYKEGGGSQFAAINYSQGLNELGHNTTLFSIYTSYAKKLLQEKNIKTVFMKPVPSKMFTLDFFTALNYLKKDKPNLIILNETFSTFWIGLLCGKLLNIPVLAYFHTYYFKNRETEIPFLNKILEKLIIRYMKLCYRSVDYFAAPSETAKDFLSTRIKINPSKIQISPYPIFENIKKSINKPNKTGITKFLYAGRIVKGKNVDLLIKVLSEFKSSNWSLTIIGDGIYKSYVQKLIYKYKLEDKIICKPFMPRDELLEEYKNYDYFISLSDMETFGFTYLEALVQELDVICLKYTLTEELFSNVKKVHMLDSKVSTKLSDQLEKITFKYPHGKEDILEESFFNDLTYKNASKILIKRWIY